MLDRYILAKLAALRDELTEALDVCDISRACDELASSPKRSPTGMCDGLVRGSGRRTADAIDTLHTVLEVTAPAGRAAAAADRRGDLARHHRRAVGTSDGLACAGEVPADPELVAAMDQVRDVCSAASSLRKAKKLRVRLPLPKLTVAVENPDALRPFVELIADELNVKTVELTERHRRLRPVRVVGQRQGGRAAPRQGRAGRHQGGQGRVRAW